MNELSHPINYVIENAVNEIAACGVVPPVHSVSIHSTDLSIDELTIRLSLWGCSYSSPILIKSIHSMKRIQLQGRFFWSHSPIDVSQQDLIRSTLTVTLVSNELIINAPIQFINKTPFTLLVALRSLSHS